MSDKNIILVPAYEPDNNLINLVQNLSKEELENTILKTTAKACINGH